MHVHLELRMVNVSTSIDQEPSLLSEYLCFLQKKGQLVNVYILNV